MGQKMTTTELTVRLKAVERDVDALDRIIVRGNGKPSLQEDVRTILKFVESWQFWSRLVIGLVITNLLGLMFAAFIWFVKIYPVIDALSREAALVVR
jgi:hypothetical protein